MNHLRLTWRRWRCDHLDHPYRHVSAVSINLNRSDTDEVLADLILRPMFCSFCDRNFYAGGFSVKAEFIERDD